MKTLIPLLSLILCFFLPLHSGAAKDAPVPNEGEAQVDGFRSSRRPTSRVTPPADLRDGNGRVEEESREDDVLRAAETDSEPTSSATSSSKKRANAAAKKDRVTRKKSAEPVRETVRPSPEKAASEADPTANSTETKDESQSRPKTMDDILVKPTPSPEPTTESHESSGQDRPKTLDDLLVKPTPSQSERTSTGDDTVQAPMGPGGPPTQEIPDPASRTLRTGKTYLVAAELGFPVLPVPALGLNGGYYLNPQTLLQAELTQGKLGWSFLSVKTTTAGLHLKRFFGNSFYGKVGADYRRIDLGGPSIPGVGNLTPDTGKAESITAGAAFGNQWQWEQFTMGVDWFGIMIPVAQLKQDLNREGFYGADLSQLEDIWSRVGRFWSVQFLRVSIGASF